MVIAFFRAVGALAAPPMRRVVALSFALAVLTFAALWLAIAAILYHTTLFDWRLLNWLVDLLGALAVLGLTWLLFPAAVTLIMGFYLERVAAAVEALDYPGRGPPRRQSPAEIVALTLRLTLLTLLFNLLSLPIYLLVPGINIFLFLALNGYLFGRGYFEVVALRRLDIGEARRVRSRFAGRIFLGGVVIAGLFALPLVNLVAPVIATAFMLHIFEALPRPVVHSFGRTP
jgi:CysZ protein